MKNKIINAGTPLEMNSHPDKIIWNGVDYIREDFINQEVEKRIAERMPSEAEKRAKARHLFVDGLNVLFACEEYDKWLHSRLTNPGVNDSQKTEGGGE